MLCCRRICKAANCSHAVFGGNRILLIGDRFIAGEYARRLTVLIQVSVETEPYWLETGLLQENMQGGFPFSIRFRWKQNLTGLRHAYCRRKCKAANCFQTGFGGNRTLLVRDRFIAGENAKLLITFKQVSVETESYWLETCLLQAMCKVASSSQSDFRGKRTGLPITIGLALWRLEVGAISSSSLFIFRSGWKL